MDGNKNVCIVSTLEAMLDRDIPVCQALALLDDVKTFCGDRTGPLLFSAGPDEFPADLTVDGIGKTTVQRIRFCAVRMLLDSSPDTAYEHRRLLSRLIGNWEEWDDDGPGLVLISSSLRLMATSCFSRMVMSRTTEKQRQNIVSLVVDAVRYYETGEDDEVAMAISTPSLEEYSSDESGTIPDLMKTLVGSGVVIGFERMKIICEKLQTRLSPRRSSLAWSVLGFYSSIWGDQVQTMYAFRIASELDSASRVMSYLRLHAYTRIECISMTGAFASEGMTSGVDINMRLLSLSAQSRIDLILAHERTGPCEELLGRVRELIFHPGTYPTLTIHYVMDTIVMIGDAPLALSFFNCRRMHVTPRLDKLVEENVAFAVAATQHGLKAALEEKTIAGIARLMMWRGRPSSVAASDAEALLTAQDVLYIREHVMILLKAESF